ncbi:hypothetical protein [Mitsuaria sp. GD03876]|uniref:hypothetical protein n=1 Tax=Mitsuaria sp. GD03876 TaxID=2975399 RepID=UPI00244D6D89|nr:hypothetical protein [Mitsuaria sp. GD03876]MDH0866998.1 hypothetical protein [Mitsuaria sp. GD03876]
MGNETSLESEKAQSVAENPPYPQKVTYAWLRAQVPVQFWLWFGGLIATAFVGGFTVANLPLVQRMFSPKDAVDVASFVNKSVVEGGSYTLGAGSSAIEIYVDDVVVRRRVVKLNVGLRGGTKERIEVGLNQERQLRIGNAVFSMVVHDIADIKYGRDVAVMSLRQL